MSRPIAEREFLRTQAQSRLDGERTAKQRNERGQFATPPILADDIVRHMVGLSGDAPLRFFEPSCGTGSFFSALLKSGVDGRLSSAVGVELDERFAAVAHELWGDLGLEVEQADFFKWSSESSERFNLLIANPPYVRHHHIAADQKRNLVDRAARRLGINVSGLSGLYVHFVLSCHRLLAPDALSGWLIPAEFMDVNYGSALREYLTRHVTLMRIHRFDPADVQFDDALVTSAVVIFRNTLPSEGGTALFSFGGTVSRPRDECQVVVNELDPSRKWSAIDGSPDTEGPVLSDFFRIRRGIATGANQFFIVPRSEALELGISPDHLTPILPSPRHIDGVEVERDDDGWPRTNPQLALIDCRLSPESIEETDPHLAAYFARADELGIKDRYLARSRQPWYRQEERRPAPFLCTYMGRGSDTDRPFRFILHHSDALVTNMYLMLHPTRHMQSWLAADRRKRLAKVHEALLSLTGDDLRRGGRVYGGGLHKIEPGELAALSAERIVDLDPVNLTLPTERDQLTIPF